MFELILSISFEGEDSEAKEKQAAAEKKEKEEEDEIDPLDAYMQEVQQVRIPIY